VPTVGERPLSQMRCQASYAVGCLLLAIGSGSIEELIEQPEELALALMLSPHHGGPCRNLHRHWLNLRLSGRRPIWFKVWLRLLWIQIRNVPRLEIRIVCRKRDSYGTIHGCLLAPSFRSQTGRTSRRSQRHPPLPRPDLEGLRTSWMRLRKNCRSAEGNSPSI